MRTLIVSCSEGLSRMEKLDKYYFQTDLISPSLEIKPLHGFREWKLFSDCDTRGIRLATQQEQKCETNIAP